MDQNISALFVLLIEPSRSQRKIIIQQFEDLGVSNFEEVETGSDALDFIESEAPDLVISSMFLPDMTGKDLVLEMRENPATEETPFMLISTETSFQELDPIKQAGASAILPKPFKARELKRAMLTTMDWNNPDHIELTNDVLEKMHVLVVDDSPLARKMIVKTLMRMGIENFEEAGDGSEGIKALEDSKFDLIVTDYNMPKVDGHEFLHYIRTQSDQKTVPVLMVTTEGDQGKLEAVQQEGVSAIIDKPFEVKAVKSLIEAAFQQHD